MRAIRNSLECCPRPLLPGSLLRVITLPLTRPFLAGLLRVCLRLFLASNLDLLLQKANLPSHLQDMPDAGSIDSLVGQGSNLFQSCNILIGVKPILAILARWFQKPGFFIATQHLRRQPNEFGNYPDGIFGQAKRFILRKRLWSRGALSFHLGFSFLRISEFPPARSLTHGIPGVISRDSQEEKEQRYAYNIYILPGLVKFLTGYLSKFLLENC